MGEKVYDGDTDGMPMATGAGALAERARGDPVRTRLVAGSVALLCLVVLIALPLLRSGGAGSAWSVEAHADGSATLRIRDLRDASGLERRLGEAGIPAHVTFAPEGTRCAAETGPSDVDTAAVAVEYAEDAITVHVGPMPAGSRLAVAAFLQVGGGIAVSAAVVPLERARCALRPL